MERVHGKNTIDREDREPARATAKRVVMAAQEVFARQADWAVFFREVLGLNGIVRQAFTTPQEVAEFERTEEYQEILRMLTQLRQNPPLPLEEQQPTQVITVRLPKAVHEALRVEAHERRTSMNKLCISKLLQYVDGQIVPTDGYERMPPLERKKKEKAVDL